jgi:hypothetical protein
MLLKTRIKSPMNLIKRYKTVIALVLFVLILVLIRSFSTDHFKADAKRNAGLSISRSNIVTMKELSNLPGNSLIIDLGMEAKEKNVLPGLVINIPPDSVLSKKYYSTITKHAGPVLIFSSDSGLAARIWMIMSQMGNKNIYILVPGDMIEGLTEKFRPDSTIGPESSMPEKKQ